jgi:hypothetical protein
LALAARGVAAEAARARLARYRHDPALFVVECFRWSEGEGPTAFQLELLPELARRRRVAVRGPHGLGKTALACWLILWFALTRDGLPDADWKVVTTASAWRQLEHYLWPELHKWARRLDWAKLGREPFDERTQLLQLTLRLSHGEAFAAASDKPELVEGAHASHLLYIFDEAKSIPSPTWDAAEGALASGRCYALAISTPGEPAGRFYDIHSRKPGYEDWFTRHVTLQECTQAGRVSPEWAEQRRRQWGENSAVYQNRVLGQFASSESDTIIPLAWVEAANERWLAHEEAGDWAPFTCVGVDVARGGADVTVLALRHGEMIKELRRHNVADTMAVTGFAAGVLQAHGGRAVVDVIGIGAGVVDRLKEQSFTVDPFNASEHTDAKDHSGELGFANKRSAAWWGLRELLDPASDHAIALPPDDRLTGDLTAPHWRVLSGGKILVESKEEIRRRIGRSTDDGDAVVMAFWKEPEDVHVFRIGRAGPRQDGQPSKLRKRTVLRVVKDGPDRGRIIEGGGPSLMLHGRPVEFR